MKNILIAGVAKSGKSLFCKKLIEKEKYNHIPLDYFTASMKRNFPDWGIKSSVIINDTSKKLSTLLNTVTNLIDDTDEKFDSVLTAYKKAMQFLNENELYTCIPEDDRVEKFDNVQSLIINIKNKTEEKKKESKNKQDKEESPNSDEQV